MQCLFPAILLLLAAVHNVRYLQPYLDTTGSLTRKEPGNELSHARFFVTGQFVIERPRRLRTDPGRRCIKLNFRGFVQVKQLNLLVYYFE